MNTEPTTETSNTQEPDYIGTATYSPEDNKLRLYTFARLSAEDYATAKAHGFCWAPKQELFVAPMWTPERAAWLEKVCGEIGDEDKDLAERAAERAERFEDRSEARAASAESARKGVSAIADGIPLGQPILVGHHSEKRARRDADRIQNGMRKAVKLWEDAEYWKQRAVGAIRAARYKERPDVRARRIKKLESDLRGWTKHATDAAGAHTFWLRDDITKEAAKNRANYSAGGGFSMPRKAGDREDFPHRQSDYGALTDSHPTLYAPRTLEEVIAEARRVYPARVDHYAKWIAHVENRLAYERAMLADSGGTVTDRTGPEVGGAVQCWASPGFGRGWSQIIKVNKVSVTIWRQWDSGRKFSQTMPLDKIRAVMTKGQVDEARAAGLIAEVDAGENVGFFLRAVADNTPAETKEQSADAAHAEHVAAADPVRKKEDFEAMKAALKMGVKVVIAPQLFPTPQWLARRIVSFAPIQPAMKILEPEAGTGKILKELSFDQSGVEVTAVEINAALAHELTNLKIDGKIPLNLRVIPGDFLEFDEYGRFDRVLMNPPFGNGQDVVHVLHALKMLAPGGVCVAVIAAGPRQHAELQPLADTWEALPDGSFIEEGTNVRTILASFTR